MCRMVMNGGCVRVTTRGISQRCSGEESNRRHSMASEQKASKGNRNGRKLEADALDET